MPRSLPCFHGNASSYLWDHDDGTTHEILQEGGEQGDLLMPMLYSLGQHRALCAVQSKPQVNERLFAFLDDIYVFYSPERVSEIYKFLEEELWRHSRIQIHAGKTQIWNSGGHVPDGVDDILKIAQVANPDARVWFGDHALPLVEHGIRVIGTPLGHWSYVQAQLRSKAVSHRVFFA